MKTLILLSKQFPFGNKEQYIAHELKYLAEKFDRVVIYPHDHFQEKDTPSFELPSNCEVIDLNRRLNRIGKVLPSLVFLYLFFRELIQVKKKVWWILRMRKHYAMWLTQWSLAKGLEDYVHSSGLKSTEIVYYSYWFSMSAVCLSILKMRNKIDGFVCRAHALDLYHEDWKSPNPKIFSLPFRYFKQRQVKLIFPISDHGKDYLLQTMPETKLERRYLGVFDFGLNPDVANNGEFVVVSCSGVDQRKRIHLIGEALSAIDRPVKWIHFGDGPLKQVAIESVTSKNVVFEYRGQTSNAEIRKFYSQTHVDLFVNVSLSEGLPVAIMECMSHGIPAIGVKDFGTSEIVLDNYTGKLLPQGFSKNDLIQAFIFMMETPNARNYRTNARAHYNANFNADRNYRDFAERLRSC
jgi:glycosyltransferase involved in cell wall biosynthesis